MIFKRPCDFCKTPYDANSKYLKRREGTKQGRFCSRSCAGKFIHPVIEFKPNVSCAYCGIDFYKTAYRKKRSKSGLYFCCRSHKDHAQRIGGIEAIMPPHYGTGNGLYRYRKLAFDNLDNSCAVCGWDQYPAVLEVNHKDLNRNNNELENLEILCPTHHQVFHYLDGSGRWGSKVLLLHEDLLPIVE